MSEGNRLPPSWSWVAIDQACSKVTDGTHHSPSKSVQASTGEYMYITAKNIKESGVKVENVTYLPASVHRPIFERCNPEPGDVLYIKDGVTTGIATVNQLDEEFSLLSSVALLKPKQHLVQPRFLKWYLNSPVGFHSMTSRMGGTAIKRLTIKKIKEGQVPIAPLPEQRRIVAKIEELFSDLDAGVAALERAKANLKRYRAAVLKAAVEGKLTEQWRAEHPEVEPASELLERILAERRGRWEQEQLAKYEAKGKKPPKNWKEKYKEPAEPDRTDLPASIPQNWVAASIDQLTSTITSGSRDWSQYYGEGSGTFIMAQNVRPSLLDLSHRQPVNPPPDDRDRERSQVVENDLLVTIVGANTGDVCRVPTTLKEHFVCQSVALMRPIDTRLSRYLEVYMSAEHGGQKQYRRYIYGQGRPHLSFDQLRMTPVLLPPIAEQAQIAALAEQQQSVVRRVSDGLALTSQRASRLRQAILKRAFEGQLVPQDPNDEPASELLARIRAEREAAEAKRPRAKGRRRRKASAADEG